MKVMLTRPFRYWRQGYAPEDYPAGEVEMDEEAARSAEQCGATARPEPKKKERKDA